MSTRRVQSSAIQPRTLGAAPPPPTPPWVRNPAWPALAAPTIGEQKLVGLYAVFPGDGVGNGGNFFAVNCAGDYTVNFGDGTSVNTATGVQTNYEYNFADVDLYDATVTLTDAGDLVERTAHGYSNGMRVQFYRIVTTTGLTEAQSYFVVNATANNFQVAATEGGAALALTTNGSASLLPYKIASVTITPQAGQNLTTVNLFVKNPTTGLQGYSAGWLDLVIAGSNIASLTIGANATTIKFNYLESVTIVELGAVTSFAHLFNNFRKLQSVDLNVPATVTDMSSMFTFCFGLTTVPLFNTASVTNMQSMFNTCVALTTVPLFNTAAVTNMQSMFEACSVLTTVPLFNTASVTNMQSMFVSCATLTTVPLFNTAAVTNMQSMFQACTALRAVPLFNTAAVTNMQSMFASCVNLTTVPLLNTASVSIMQNMFFSCNALVNVLPFNTAAVTNMLGMFFSCSALTTVPLFNTAAVTNMQNMFSGCRALTTVPLFNTAAVINMSGMFASCTALTTVPLFNTAAVTTMLSLFNGSSGLLTVPLFNTAAVTNMTSMFNGCGTLTTLPLFNTAAVTTMNQMLNGCSNLTAVPALVTTAVTSSANFSNMFLSCNSLARIQAKDFRFTFSVAACKLSATALGEIFTNLPTVASSQTITITNNYGIGTSVTARSTTRVAQSTVSTLADTTSLANGMLVIGTGTGISTGITVVSDVSADTLTLITHGLPDGTPVAFSSLGTTTGVSLWTIYYVVSTAADTFQVATTIGGAAIDLTGTGGNMVVRYANYITNIVTNTSITTSTPMATTGTGNLDYRTINTAPAMLKNWAITY